MANSIDLDQTSPVTVNHGLSLLYIDLHYCIAIHCFILRQGASLAPWVKSWHADLVVVGSNAKPFHL